MTTNDAENSLIVFRQRLLESLSAVNTPGSASIVAREFNRRGNGITVTIAGAARWLEGECYPTHKRLTVLADWLGVSAQWLLYGSTAEGASPGVARSADPDYRLLAQDLALLDEHSKQIVQNLVLQLMKAQCR